MPTAPNATRSKASNGKISRDKLYESCDECHAELITGKSVKSFSGNVFLAMPHISDENIVKKIQLNAELNIDLPPQLSPITAIMAVAMQE